MRLFAVLLIAIFLSPSLVKAKPIELERGSSPDGRFYVTIDTNSDDSGKDQLQIRTKDGTIVGNFDWHGFDQEITSRSASVHWNPKSLAVALNWYEGKNWTGSAVYAEFGGKWLDISYPYHRVDKRRWISRRIGCYIALEWLPDDILKMDYDDEAYRFDPSGKMVVAKPLWIYLQISEHLHKPMLAVKKTEEYSAKEN